MVKPIKIKLLNKRVRTLKEGKKVEGKQFGMAMNTGPALKDRLEPYMRRSEGQKIVDFMQSILRNKKSVVVQLGQNLYVSGEKGYGITVFKTHYRKAKR